MQLLVGALLLSLSLLMLVHRVRSWQLSWSVSIQRLSMSTKGGYIMPSSRRDSTNGQSASSRRDGPKPSRRDSQEDSSRRDKGRSTSSLRDSPKPGRRDTQEDSSRRDSPKPSRRDTQEDSTPIVYVEHPYVKSYVTLLPGKARLFQDGNPLIFGGAVGDVIGKPSSGGEVIVKDHRGNDLGRGFYNPDSQYRVRLMARSYEDIFQLSLTDIITKRINDTIIHRKTMSLPSIVTSIYRLVNGEGDRLGGLMVDVIGSIVVIQSSAVWVEVNKFDVVKSIIDILIQRENYNIRKIIWRRVDTRLKQDGYEGDVEDEVVYHKSPDDLTMKKEIVVENGIKYAVFPDDGQKTGFYCDQRDNRQTLKSLSLNKTVLDMYCYTGGFALNAALGGAEAVTAIDSSQLAIDTCLENAVLNQVSHLIKGYKIDAIGFMQQMIQEGKLYDIVIVDPPKLAPTRTSLPNAKSKYIKINTLAMSLVKPGGLLLTCSCSAAVTQSGEFTNIISEAARIARKDIKVLSTTSAAMDHPVHLHYQEGKYLTAAFLVVA